MKFVLFCEGATEKGALPDFLRRWLNSKLATKIGVQPVGFNGWSEMVKESAKKAHLHLARTDVIGVIALLDLYGPTFYPPDRKTVTEKFEWGKKYLEDQVNHPHFHQYFAVHDVEAWILSQPSVLPAEVRKKLPAKTEKPETINFNEPPADLLNRLYQETTGRSYKKLVYGEELFRKLDPQVVYQKCVYFKKLADDLEQFARTAIEANPHRT